MRLIAGLGNPGEKYAGNRHNIGFRAIDEIARGYVFGPWKRRFQGLAAEGQIGSEKCILLKPGTYMNESGRSAGEAMRFYKLPLKNVIVIHDELDLKPGTLRVKTGGGNAGHNGLKSISAHIGNEYVRVRLGIGHPGDKALVSNYVLQDFTKADGTWLMPLLEGLARGMAHLVEGNEAAFLSEAARGRGNQTQTAKASTSPPAFQKAAAPASKVEAPTQAEAPANTDGATKAEPVTVTAPTNTEASTHTEAPTKAETDTLAMIAAAASRPIKAMPVAAREGGGGAVSRVVILPEPKPSQSSAPERAFSDMRWDVKPVQPLASQPEKAIEAENEGDETPPLTAASQIEWASSPSAPQSVENAVGAPKSPPLSPEKKKGGFLSSLFRSRPRGGV